MSSKINPIERLIRAAGHSFRGFAAAYRHERAFREECWVLIAIVPLAIWLGETGLERLLLIGSWILVMIVEILNSAIEAAIDRIGPEHHELSGRAKDLGSAAVLAAILLAAAVWLVILAL